VSRRGKLSSRQRSHHHGCSYTPLCKAHHSHHPKTRLITKPQMNGIWCLLLLGRMSMVTGWYEMIRGKVKPGDNEFVSVDVTRYKDPTGSYEMLSRDRDVGKTPEPLITPAGVTPLSPVRSPPGRSGRATPDYFGREARYKSPSRSFSAPKPPQGTASWDSKTGNHQSIEAWNSMDSHASPQYAHSPQYEYPRTYMDPLNMNKI